MNLNRALRANVFRTLADGPRTAASLSECAGMTARDAMDLLDTLVALGLLERSGPLYSNTAESAYYLDPASPGFAGRMLGSVRFAA